MDTEKQIIELENKVTFLERTVQELNEVIYSQQKKLDALESASKKMAKALRDLNDSSADGMPASEKPPHY